MPNATGFRRVQTTARWQARQAARRELLNNPDLIRQTTPEVHGWRKDDEGRWWLPHVTDVYLEDDDRYLTGWALVYDELGGHRMHVPPALLGRLTQQILADNGVQ